MWALVALREAHETDRAKKAVRRTGRTAPPVEDGTTPSQQPTIRQGLLRDIHALLRSYNDQAVGSGLARKARWQEGMIIPTTGNTANAILAAGQRAATVCINL